MDAFLQRLLTPAVATPFLIFVIFSVYDRLTRYNIPKGVPWIGKDTSKIFAGTRASIAGLKDVKKWLEVGYDQVYLHLLQTPIQVVVANESSVVWQKQHVLHPSR